MRERLGRMELGSALLHHHGVLVELAVTGGAAMTRGHDVPALELLARVKRDCLASRIGAAPAHSVEFTGTPTHEKDVTPNNGILDDNRAAALGERTDDPR